VIINENEIVILSRRRSWEWWSREHGHAPFYKICRVSCPDCRWEHTCQIWSP